MPYFISYDQTERMIATMLERADAWQPEAVVGITRGGLIPATMAASMLALPLAILGWDRRGGPMRWIGPPPKSNRILLVDDCCATGLTMQSARDTLHRSGIDALTLTITHDPDTTSFIPDLSHPMRELFRFPWERGEATPAARAQRQAGAAADRAYERPFLGLDLDGVFLPDVAIADYRSDLTRALQTRHALEAFPRLPRFDWEHAVVITGRPESDRAMTLEWLARWVHSALPLECRPQGTADDPDSVAQYKAQAATRWGCTHFIESDAEQAIRISAAAPHLVVSWWHAIDARAWLIGAARQPLGEANSN
ncbi:MAG: phosphoribosyltransferase [Rhodopila sp.]